jgi:predicted nucleic acid-binding protein
MISRQSSAVPDQIVVNSSPLIVLARTGRIDLLTLVGVPIHVPESVSLEVRVHSDEAARLLDTVAWLQRVPDAEMLPLVRGWDLGAGESAVLEWAQANRPARAIIDDYAARKLASVLSVQVTGTLGLALLAKQRGMVPLARPLVEEFARAGLYLSESVVQRALRFVGE